MTELASLDDVRLVLAIEESGSIGAAASMLHVSQPSASQRLGVLERRVGVALVERDTTGARLTPAGELFAEHGRRAVDLVERAVSGARSPEGRRLRIGTIGSLAPVIFPALEQILPGHTVEATTDHGRYLAGQVADGALDAAVMGLAPAESPAPGARRHRVGVDDLVLVGRLPRGGSTRRPLTGARVAVAAYDHQHEVAAARVARLGADPAVTASTATAVALGRRRGWLAAIPRTAAVSLGVRPVEVPRLRVDQPVWLVTRGPRSAVLVERVGELGRVLGLRRLR